MWAAGAWCPMCDAEVPGLVILCASGPQPSVRSSKDRRGWFRGRSSIRPAVTQAHLLSAEVPQVWVVSRKILNLQWVFPFPAVIVVDGVVVVVVGFDSQWGVERKVQPWTESVLVPTQRCFGGYLYGWEARPDNEKRSHLPINTGGRYVPAIRPSPPSHHIGGSFPTLTGI